MLMVLHECFLGQLVGHTFAPVAWRARLSREAHFLFFFAFVDQQPSLGDATRSAFDPFGSWSLAMQLLRQPGLLGQPLTVHGARSAGFGQLSGCRHFIHVPCELICVDD